MIKNSKKCLRDELIMIQCVTVLLKNLIELCVALYSALCTKTNMYVVIEHIPF